MTLRLALAALLIPLPALSCPVGGDMGAGVVLTTGDGNREIHQETGPDLTTVIVTFGDGSGDGSLMTFRHGVYALTSVPVVAGRAKPGEAVTFAPLGTASGWPAPAPGTGWDLPGEGGGRAEAGPLRTIAIGDCTYQGFDIRIDYADDDYAEVYHFLPDLGIGLYVEGISAGVSDVYTYTGIAAR